MNHHHKKTSEDEYTHHNSSGADENLSSEELLKKNRRYKVEMTNIQNCSTVLNSEPEEIINMDLPEEVTTDTEWYRIDSKTGEEVQETVKENILTDSYSGIDVAVVRSLLGEKLQSMQSSVFPVTTDTSVTIECAISNEKVQQAELPVINEIADFSMLETIQTTGNVSALIGKDLSSNKLEPEGMRNTVNCSNNYENTQQVPVAGETAVRENFYETNSHVFDCYIENDSSGMHNQAYDSYNESAQPFSDAVVAGISDDDPDEKKSTFFGLFRKTRAARRVLNETIRQIIRDYPLLSEDELFEFMKDTDPFISLKLNKKRLVKVLVRLKLSSGYERFRCFVKA
ncbi:MAG TPA: hypothetical protein VHO70_14175 [Chitinispirillaceae bacterium]|nr:hypothetical protein [Chitinispirillaceae bacterium]